MPNTEQTQQVERAAACDRHLPKHLRTLVPDNQVNLVRVTNVAIPDERYTCDCGKAAHWFVRRFPEEV
jgi:hypothetical protein